LLRLSNTFCSLSTRESNVWNTKSSHNCLLLLLLEWCGNPVDWRRMLQTRRSRVRFPITSLDLFLSPNPVNRKMSLGSSQTPRDVSVILLEASRAWGWRRSQLRADCVWNMEESTHQRHMDFHGCGNDNFKWLTPWSRPLLERPPTVQLHEGSLPNSQHLSTCDAMQDISNTNWCSLSMPDILFRVQILYLTHYLLYRSIGKYSVTYTTAVWLCDQQIYDEGSDWIPDLFTMEIYSYTHYNY
jgi:hypothetical protein